MVVHVGVRGLKAPSMLECVCALVSTTLAECHRPESGSNKFHNLYSSLGLGLENAGVV
jgi:hypothetical protein